MRKLFFCATLMIATLISCKTTKQSTYDYDYINITKQGVIQRPVMVDLAVDNAKQTITRTFRNTTMSMAEQNIVKEFVKANNCDVVVQPNWDTEAEASSNKTTIEITLTGFPARYQNFRNYEPKDSSLLIGRFYSTGAVVPVRTGGAQTQKIGLFNMNNK